MFKPSELSAVNEKVLFKSRLHWTES